MKLFGGGSPQQPKKDPAEPDAHDLTPRQEAQREGQAHRPTAPRPGEQPSAAHRPTAPRPGEQPSAAHRPTASHSGEQPSAAHRPTAPRPGEQPGAAHRPTAPRPGEQPGAAHRPTAPRPGEQPAHRLAASGHAAPQHPAEEPEKKKLSGRQKRNRILIVIVAATLAIIAGMSAAAAMMMRPPTVHQPTSQSAEADRPAKKTESAAPDRESESEETEYDEGDALVVDEDMGARREGVYTVLVAATDIDETRTDALMVATLDTVNDTVNVINIPRDLMSNCSRVGDAKKINAAYGTKKGIETTKNEVRKVLGFTPDQYVVVNFNGIAEIIDALGGVTYEVPWRMKYDDPTQNLHIDFQPGETKMDGQAAVEFMRWRKNNSGVSTGVKGTTGGDEERIEKDQKFLKFLAKQVFSLGNVPKIPSLAQVVFKNVKTDLTAGEVLWLAWQLYDVKNENINMMTLPGYGAMSYAGTGTMYSFYFPYRSQTLEMVNEFINPYEKKITSIDVITAPQSGGSKSKSSSSKTTVKKETAPAESQAEKTSDATGSSGAEQNEESGSQSSGSQSNTNQTSGSQSSSSQSSSSQGSTSPTDEDVPAEPNGTGGTGSGSAAEPLEGGDGTDAPERGADGEAPAPGADGGSPSGDGRSPSGADGSSSSGTDGSSPSGTDANPAEPAASDAPAEPAPEPAPVQEPAPAAEPSLPEGLFQPGATPDPPAGT